MHCPSCNASDTRVIDSRMLLEENSVRRRRKCDTCEMRFTTYENIFIQMPLIVKKDGRRENYNREKIMKGLKKACQKRPISIDDINLLINGVEKSLLEISPTEVKAKDLGEIIMDHLKKLDPVSYVRFASFYWDYQDIEDFVYGLKNNLHSEKSISDKGEKRDYQ
ncbi:MAG: transcriptional repressor NrdR [Proteobacteria bacterium]|jgi:transcriptional repressor NrdR|nr:transcriptional repressor NrdR [Pseudomonadota bacterium]